MMHEQKKLGKIVEELTMFFFSIGANDSTARIRLEDKKAIITFSSNYELEHEHKLESMEKYLKCGRNDGLEDTYWELAGAGDPGGQSVIAYWNHGRLSRGLYYKKHGEYTFN